MNTLQHIRQAIAFAMVDGLKFSILWCIGFFCFFKGVGNSTLGAIAICAITFTPIAGCILAHKFKKEVRENGPINFGKAYIYSFLIYIFASVIMAIFCFAYFNWIDNGAFAEAEIQALRSPEAIAAMQGTDFMAQMDLAAKQEGYKNFEDAILNFSPINLAASIFNMNFFIGALLALPTALFAKTRD